MRKKQDLTEKITIKVTPAEKARFDKEASEKKLNRSEYIRQELLQSGRQMDEEAEKEIYVGLMNIGNTIGTTLPVIMTEQPVSRQCMIEMLSKIQKEVGKLCQSLN